MGMQYPPHLNIHIGKMNTLGLKYYLRLHKSVIVCISWILIKNNAGVKYTIYMEGKYTEWPNPQKAENHACDRQSGLSDSAPRNHILVAWGKVA